MFAMLAKPWPKHILRTTTDRRIVSQISCLGRPSRGVRGFQEVVKKGVPPAHRSGSVASHMRATGALSEATARAPGRRESVKETQLIGNILNDNDPDGDPGVIGAGLTRSTSAPPQLIIRHDGPGAGPAVAPGETININGEEVRADDPRLSREYYNYYYQQRPLDPRLPPPLVNWAWQFRRDGQRARQDGANMDSPQMSVMMAPMAGPGDLHLHGEGMSGPGSAPATGADRERELHDRLKEFGRRSASPSPTGQIMAPAGPGSGSGSAPGSGMGSAPGPVATSPTASAGNGNGASLAAPKAAVESDAYRAAMLFRQASAAGAGAGSVSALSDQMQSLSLVSVSGAGSASAPTTILATMASGRAMSDPGSGSGSGSQSVSASESGQVAADAGSSGPAHGVPMSPALSGYSHPQTSGQSLGAGLNMSLPQQYQHLMASPALMGMQGPAPGVYSPPLQPMSYSQNQQMSMMQLPVGMPSEAYQQYRPSVAGSPLMAVMGYGPMSQDVNLSQSSMYMQQRGGNMNPQSYMGGSGSGYGQGMGGMSGMGGGQRRAGFGSGSGLGSGSGGNWGPGSGPWGGDSERMGPVSGMGMSGPQQQPYGRSHTGYRGGPGRGGRRGARGGFGASGQNGFEFGSGSGSGAGAGVGPFGHGPGAGAGAGAGPGSGSGSLPAMGLINGSRSSWLDEFRLNKANANLSLKEVVQRGLILDLAMDQYGSRFIQQRLDSASADEKQGTFEQLVDHILRLCTDVFGNYVVQKFLEEGLRDHPKIIANKLVGNVLPLSLNMYGCRVIQKALEVLEVDQQSMLVRELNGHVMQCVKDQNGNHVIQKCIEKVPGNIIGFIIDSFAGHIFHLSTHPYGCRVIQRLLEHCSEEQRNTVLGEVLDHTDELCKNQYGNYVIQHVLIHGTPWHRGAVVQSLRGKVLLLARHKFASNVVEKGFAHASRVDRQMLIEEVLGRESDSTCPLIAMVKDQYANYVVQKMIDIVDEEQRALLVARIKRHVPNLRKIPYGKHIIARVEQITGKPILS